MPNLDELRKAQLELLDRKSKQEHLEVPTEPPRAATCPEAWFLGPKGENHELLRTLLLEALASHVRHREEFHPEDPELITGEIKASQEYATAVRNFSSEARRLFEYLRWSAPISSMRHQGHMLWDQALPAMVGYFAAMLYNQNNVAAEASPVTTLLELRVGEDLCRMLGFGERPSEGRQATVVPWGHVTCGGSIANIEAMWAARNAKFFPLAACSALRQDARLNRARGLKVVTAKGELQRMVDLSDWDLLNLPLDEIVGLSQRLEDEYAILPKVSQEAIAAYALPKLGILQFAAQYPKAFAELPRIFVPQTAHYSWRKGATLLGLGEAALNTIKIDEDARLDLKALERELKDCSDKCIPIIAVVAVMGSTEESAVDPLAGILELRERFRKKGLYFAVHCDAAWGGYFASILRNPDSSTIGGVAPPKAAGPLLFAASAQGKGIPALPMSQYVREQFHHLGHADSITVDPHKAGYVPYPAGALCYSNSSMRDMISLSAPVVFHNEAEPTVGIYGVEGSKPGAAAAAVWLAHRVIRPTRAGYGAILEGCMWTATRWYCRLLTIHKRHPWLRVVPVTRLPLERDEGPSQAKIASEIERIAEFACLSNHAFREQSGNGELGPDLVINAFACNFSRNREWNRSLEAANTLNNRIFELCSAVVPRDYRDDAGLGLMLTSSSFAPAGYGQDFVDRFARRLGVDPEPGRDISFLISTSMDPWETDVEVGDRPRDFLAVLEKALCDAAREVIRDLGGDLE
jgi:glutamate/tyrosine decarboxylase-like PLP-dependent enzyme